jgi:hypothetical protein
MSNSTITVKSDLIVDMRRGLKRMCADIDWVDRLTDDELGQVACNVFAIISLYNGPYFVAANVEALLKQAFPGTRK